jgi:hypothetical protein
MPVDGKCHMDVLVDRKLYFTKMHEASVANWMNMPAG